MNGDYLAIQPGKNVGPRLNKQRMGLRLRLTDAVHPVGAIGHRAMRPQQVLIPIDDMPLADESHPQAHYPRSTIFIKQARCLSTDSSGKLLKGQRRLLVSSRVMRDPSSSHGYSDTERTALTPEPSERN